MNAGNKKGEDSDDEDNPNKVSSSGNSGKHYSDEKNNRMIAETTRVFSY